MSDTTNSSSPAGLLVLKKYLTFVLKYLKLEQLNYPTPPEYHANLALPQAATEPASTGKSVTAARDSALAAVDRSSSSSSGSGQSGKVAEVGGKVAEVGGKVSNKLKKKSVGKAAEMGGKVRRRLAH